MFRNSDGVEAKPERGTPWHGLAWISAQCIRRWVAADSYQDLDSRGIGLLVVDYYPIAARRTAFLLVEGERRQPKGARNRRRA